MRPAPGRNTERKAGFRVAPVDKRRAMEHFEGLAPAYDDRVARGPLVMLRRREHDAVLRLARFDGRSARTVLDVGCGGGFAALAAKRRGLRVTAVDFSPAMVEKIRPHVDEAWVADIERLDVSRTWDIVVCAGVLDFVLDPERAFANLAAVTAPGGRLVVQAPDAGMFGLLYRLEKKFSRIEVNLFSLDWFKAQARKCGLRIRANLLPQPVSRVLLFDHLAS